MGRNGRCAGCKYLRKRCRSDCIFSPYFPSNGPRTFEFVHRIYGASNLSRMLQRIAEEVREEAADSLYFEAQCRVEDPVYGCVRIIHHLQQQLSAAQDQLLKAQAQISFYSYGPAQLPCPSNLLLQFELAPFHAPDFSAHDLGLK